jgi:bleomycin hydrolase
MRMGAESIDLSEMYIVRNIYLEKGMNYTLRQGNAQFGQGSLAHDYINAAAKYGLVPESEFSGRVAENAPYNHSKLAKSLQEILEETVESKAKRAEWYPKYLNTLDQEIGQEVDQFTYEGNVFTPKEFYRALPLNANDYHHITSFTHHPFYTTFILEIPDNFSNGAYFNVTLADLVEITDEALQNGYTLVWDGDVSEEGFDAKNGLAELSAEKEVSQLSRQNAFMNFKTTDDHLMHIVGAATDKNGDKYYIIKNSWGKIGPFEGYLYMSEDYFKMKTVAITVHKDGLPPDIAQKMSL